MSEPTAVLLLPRSLEGFIQHDQAIDLLRSPAFHAVEPGRIPYGAYLRAPAFALGPLASAHARATALPGDPRVLAIAHPVQWPLAAALLRRHPRAELWDLIWDRYEDAFDASPRARQRLERFHSEAMERAVLAAAVSEPLAERERAAGRKVVLWPSAADSFPDRDAGADVVAVSLGHLGWRIDWALVRAVCERMRDELTLLMIGKLAEGQLRDDADFEACRALPNIAWLGFQPDEAAARLISLADTGVLFFKPGPFNDAALPNRILKAARLGRRTITPELAGVRTWEQAVVRAGGADAWIEALRAERGVRASPHAELRAWALAQTAESSNAPLWRRLSELGLPGPDG